MQNKKSNAPKLRRPPHYSAVAWALVACLPAGLLAQSISPDALANAGGSYTPLTATQRSPWAPDSAPLYPLANPQAVPPAQQSAVLAAASAAVDYSAHAEAAQVVVEVDRNGVPADGQSAVVLTLRVLGQDGRPLANRVYATVEITGGRLLLSGASTDEAGPGARDADRATPGVQVPVVGGVAQVRLLAPATPQDVQVRATVGAQQASGLVSFVPDMRPMVAAGLIEGVIHFQGGGGLLSPARTNDGFEREIQHVSRVFSDGQYAAGARTAFFLKGVVKGDYLLTAAYDSDKEVQSRLIRDIVPGEFYPVYGDASLRGNDALSSTALYVRVDKDKSYVLYGDFSTGAGSSERSGGGAVAALQQRSLGAYTRNATGLRGHYERDSVTANVFAINDTLHQAVDEFASQGSGPYGLRNSGGVQNSETVEVVVRDRNMPTRILTVRPLLRLVDYSFEPFSGRILLNQFLPAFDADLNPVSLRVSYDVDQGGEAFWIVGADGQLRVSDTLELGAAVVQDQNPLASSEISSANLSWRVAPSTTLVAELAQTTALANTNSVNQNSLPGFAARSGNVTGQAWRVEVAHETESTQGRVFVGQSDPTFNNPAALLNGGKAEAMVQGAYKLTDATKLYAQAQRSEDRNPGMASHDEARLGVKVRLTDKLFLDAGLRTVHQGQGTLTASAAPFASTSGLTGSIASGAAGGLAGYGNQTIDPASGLPSIQSNTLAASPTLNQAVALRSDTARVGLGYKATERLTLGGEVESAISGDSLQRYALGGDYLVAERTRLYARAEQQTGTASASTLTPSGTRSNALVFGVDSSYWHDTQLFSEYRLRDAVSGQDVQLASGIRNSWDLQPGVRADAAYEWTEVLSGVAPTTQAIALGLDYTAHPLWRGSTKVEYRVSGDVPGSAVSQAFDTTLWQAMVARKLSRDWTFLARNYLLQTAYEAHGGVFQDRVQLGAAYRDNERNRVNALAKYEYKTEVDDSNAASGELSSRAHIVSVIADYHPSRPWWLTGKFAAKWQQDQFEAGVSDSFQAQLYSGRLTYDITENWDLGLMLATQMGQHGAQQSAAGVELGYLVQQNLWISAGYNYAGFAADADLAGYEYTREGVYLRLRFKFDHDLFASSSQTINRSLDR
ncbi:hypothetical protein DIC66_01620 [Rhodoferax lacus]|uniref:TonB-dependent receptor n=1 Tax=Rhodoferax lacus TaxID=2184758 RepID=A0A3E1RH90_9BURK|nr:hypothetical protein [Rhodoferax lacus]RFO98611.1 hypothetical protein DIC66_01620 [Rhodoferax lacus]